MKKEKGYEYELYITNLDPKRKRTKSIVLSSNVSFSSDTGMEFCNLGFCNIRFKGTFKTEVVRLPTHEKVMLA